MNTLMTTACALGLAFVWGAGPALAADDTVKDKAERTKDKLETTGENTKDKLKDTGETAKDKLKSAGEKVKDKTVEAKDKIKGAFKKSEDRVASNDDVTAAQQALKDKGFDPGPIDGRMGPRTHAAISDFQKKEGLKVTGRLDSDTKSHLTGTAATSSTATPSTTTPSASPATGAATAPPSAPANSTGTAPKSQTK